MRGKHQLLSRLRHARRLTPACAGKTSARSRSPPSRRAHPRVCGENGRVQFEAGSLHGSPPRVRGKPSRRRRRTHWGGLTPACAGKTGSTPTRSSGTTAHPRVCGENVWGFIKPVVDVGSPPRVRGKHQPRAPRPRRPRLTPACAGKTSPTRPRSSKPTAHPRVCGENGQPIADLIISVGSPPRVRGKRHGEGLVVPVARLTPACAGKT